MKRFTVRQCLNNPVFDDEKTFLVRVTHGDFYFLGWPEAAEDYNITLSRKPIMMARCHVADADLIKAVIASDGSIANSIETFMATNSPKEVLLERMNHGSDADAEYNIFEFTKSEWKAVYGTLRDGDYLIRIVPDKFPFRYSFDDGGGIVIAKNRAAAEAMLSTCHKKDPIDFSIWDWKTDDFYNPDYPDVMNCY